MKCKKCGHENREGINFCEECGEKLSAKVNRICPSCGHQNRAGVKFCEECGTALAAGAVPAGAAPAGAVPAGAVPDASAPGAAGSMAGPPPVVVQVAGTPRGRRFNPLWLVLLLFLVVSCCCFLLLFGLVDAPAFASTLVERMREPLAGLIIKPVVKNPNKNGDPDKALPLNCDAVNDRLKAANLGQGTHCFAGVNQCWTDVVGLDDYTGIEISYDWDGNVQGKAQCVTLDLVDKKMTCAFPFDARSNRVDYWVSIGECQQYMGSSAGWLGNPDAGPVPPVVAPPDPCEAFADQLKSANLSFETTCPDGNTCFIDVKGENYAKYKISYRWSGNSIAMANCGDVGTYLNCSFPDNNQSDRVDFWVSIPGCGEEYLGGSDGWLDQEKASAPEPPVSPPVVCCNVVESDDVTLFREPPEVGTLFLGFKLFCDQPWVLENGSIDWDAYVGAKGDILWTSGTCSFYGEDARQLECAGAIKDQKKSRTKIVLEGCPALDITFQSPYYSPPEPGVSCPSGQIMCGGSCCSSSCCSPGPSCSC